MTVTEQLAVGAFAAHVQLREDMVRRSHAALTRAARLRNAIAIVTALFMSIVAVAWLLPLQRPDWIGHGLIVSLGLTAMWLLAALNVWCCQQRWDDSRQQLVDYVNRIPVQ